MGKQKQRLTRIINGLSEEQLRSLLDYAEFLQSREESQPVDKSVKQEPLLQPRPEQENVVAAIKRLRAGYFMLNTDLLLNESSALMAQFMMQGREAKEVIDDLEALFQSHYQKYLNDD